MALKTLVAVAVTAAFAVSPLTQAQSDKASSGASAGATATFSSLDKDKDGSISREAWHAVGDGFQQAGSTEEAASALPANSPAFRRGFLFHVYSTRGPIVLF
jgi:hypothetical protein